MNSSPPAIESKTGRLIFRSLFLHAWDLEGDGIETVMDWMGQAGLNTLCLAGTYHHGWFIHPQAPKHRGFMTEGDVCYFRPQESLYRNLRLRPKPSRYVRERDLFAEVGKRLDHGLRLVSWTIGAHNTTFGLAYPELTQHNVYGDSLPHALCPANQEVREYLKTLVRDLATNYPLWAVQLEAFGWMGFAHGHHHERDLVGLNSFELELMGFCVCPACSRQAEAAGVEMDAVKKCLKETLDGAFREAPQRPPNHPVTLAELAAANPALAKFQAWRAGFLHALFTEIKQVSLKGTPCRLLLQTEFDPALAGVVDGFGCGAYQKNPAETAQICRLASAALTPGWNGLLQCFIQLGMGVPESEAQLKLIIAAVRENGCNGINFYNHSESPPKMLGWLAKIMPTFHQ